MYQQRRARVLLAVLSLVALVLITIDFRSGGSSDGGPMDQLRGVATTVFSPVQEGLATLVRPVGNAVGSVGELFRLRAENERLRSRLRDLEQRRESFRDLQRENTELRSLLDMRGRVQLETVTAQTIGFAPSNYEWTISLDVGAEDGIRRDMPVINADGLVGRVIQVSPGAARVLLAIDPQFSAASRLASSAETGIISGEGGRLMTFEPLDSEAAIEQGDTVVTSPYENGLYPSGIPIGSVEAPGEPSTRLQRDVGVRPFVDFTSLNHVLVLLHRPGEPLPPLEGFQDVPFTPPDVAPGRGRRGGRGSPGRGSSAGDSSDRGGGSDETGSGTGGAGE